MHYYKFNLADWVLDTAHLTLEEEAVYARLINLYYADEQPISQDTSKVIRRLRLTGHEATVDTILAEYFQLTDGAWRHKRCDREIAEYRLLVHRNRDNGARGGRPKGPQARRAKAKNPAGTDREPSGLPVGSNWQPTGLNQEPLSNNHKPNSFRDKQEQRSAKNKQAGHGNNSFVDQQREEAEQALRELDT